jgi:signal transduction histidine kinase
LKQVLGNLLTNAARYTPDGGHIALTVESEGADWRRRTGSAAFRSRKARLVCDERERWRQARSNEGSVIPDPASL